jgi:hypothetical protein
MSVHRILLLQIATFLVLAPVLCLRFVRVALMPPAARRAVAHRVAMEQFPIRDLARKTERTGILIFVSLAERYAHIIADDGVAARVPQSEWGPLSMRWWLTCATDALPMASSRPSMLAATCWQHTFPAPTRAATCCQTGFI